MFPAKSLGLEALQLGKLCFVPSSPHRSRQEEGVLKAQGPHMYSTRYIRSASSSRPKPSLRLLRGSGEARGRDVMKGILARKE